MAALLASTRIAGASLAHCGGLNDDEMTGLAAGVSANRRLRWLDLSATEADRLGADALLRALEANGHVQSLTWGCAGHGNPRRCALCLRRRRP